MSELHERPGVYSVYDMSSVVSGGRAVQAIGVAARAAKGAVDKPVTVTGWAAGVSAFGEDETAGMSTILKLLFENGASAVTAVRVADEGGTEDYARAFAALGKEEVRVLVCDSGEEDVQRALRDAVEEASRLRHERIAVVGRAGAEVSDLIARAEALNSERMVLVGPDALDGGGKPLSGVFAAAAVAALAAAGGDPAVPLNGGALKGLTGLSRDYGDNDIDLLVRGGVTPLECVGGVVSPVRGITTRTKTGGAADATWRELTTILIVDDVIPAVRAALRSRFSRSKNTARSRAAIRSQVIVELEKKLAAEIISGYDGVTVAASEEDPTVCLVEFGFSVAHGLNQVRLTVHIEI
ncbi:phage tail sheath subtilisin-like domain-containing protein [uncultured Oscillibacter sp.]|uniref:phage tail sheath subtilisin-like domain-containing protein n=1 Tax=uncultured Oscillibacter sp. TaxID=876091 RepID=UPI00262B53F6|nr:phage tail sheath subtilisin-like domain-containing protein [uncultured Oscillibacter sp.]